MIRPVVVGLAIGLIVPAALAHADPGSSVAVGGQTLGTGPASCQERTISPSPNESALDIDVTAWQEEGAPNNPMAHVTLSGDHTRVLDVSIPGWLSLPNAEGQATVVKAGSTYAITGKNFQVDAVCSL
jgi:Mycobacterium 19 kDa lipoprotein antigen